MFGRRKNKKAALDDLRKRRAGLIDLVKKSNGQSGVVKLRARLAKVTTEILEKERGKDA